MIDCFCIELILGYNEPVFLDTLQVDRIVI